MSCNAVIVIFMVILGFKVLPCHANKAVKYDFTWKPCVFFPNYKKIVNLQCLHFVKWKIGLIHFHYKCPIITHFPPLLIKGVTIWHYLFKKCFVLNAEYSFKAEVFMNLTFQGKLVVRKQKTISNPIWTILGCLRTTQPDVRENNANE